MYLRSTNSDLCPDWPWIATTDRAAAEAIKAVWRLELSGWRKQGLLFFVLTGLRSPKLVGHLRRG